jgi:hypothetical protein
MPAPARTFRFAALLLASGAAFAGGHPSGTSTLPLLSSRGSDLACNQGDWAHCPNAQGGLAAEKYHAIFIEIPPGTGNLTLELFDPDVGAGGAAEATAGRDTASATAAQAAQFSLANPAGTAQTIRFERGNGVSTIGATVTGLATAAGTAVSCTTAGTTSADNTWCPIFTTANPAAGHWELRVASITGTPIHYFGVRARDTVTGRDLNVYLRSYFHFGNQNSNAGRSYAGANALFPYVTEGCSLRTTDFDSDDEGTQSLRLVSRTGIIDQTLTEASADLSSNDAWNDELLPFTAATAAREYGVWRYEFSTGIDTSNHVTSWCGSELSTASPPSTQPQGGVDRGAGAVTSGESYRYYLPSNGGTAPAKPFVEQRLFLVSGANPPTAGGGVTRVQVTLSIANPTPYPITFATAAGNTVVATIPASTGTGGNNLRFGNFSAPTASCGTATLTGAGTGARTLTWDPGTVAATSSCTLFYQFDVDAPNNAAAGTTIQVTGNGAGVDAAETTARFLDETGTRFVFGPLCPLSITLGTNLATPVTLAHVEAAALGDERVRLRFATDTEAGTVGFDVFEGERRLSPQTLPAQGGNAIGWWSYETTLGGWRGGPLWIEETSVDGRRVRHGPFAVGATHGRTTPPAAYDWTTARREAAGARASLGAATAVELLVDRDGPQRVTAAALTAAGATFDGVPVAELALLRGDRPVAIAIDGGPNWGAGSALRFVGQALPASVYSRTAVYRLLRDRERARRIVPRGPAATPAPPRDHAPRASTAAPDLAWSFASPLADPWYAYRLARTGNARPSARLQIDAGDVVPGTPALLRVTLWGGLDHPEGADHAVSLAFNGAALGVDRFDGLNPRHIDIALPAGAVVAGANTVDVFLEPETGIDTDVVHVEGASLHHDAVLRARDDRVELTLPRDEAAADAVFDDDFGDVVSACRGAEACTAWEASGFSGAPVIAYQADAAVVTTPTVVAQTVAGTVRVDAPARAGSRLLLATPAAHHAPAVRRARASVDLLAAPAQWLAIGPAALLDAVAPLVAARQAEGLSARAVALEDVFAQGTTGDVDPETLRAFIARAAAVAGTRYVVLVGGDTYDYFDRTGAGSVSQVPTFYRPTHPLLRHGPTDVPYGDLDGDGRLDLALGRLPGRTIAEIVRLVDKTLAHAAAAPAAATFATDVSGNGVDFASYGVAQAAALDPGFAAVRPLPDQIALDTLALDPARSALFGAINQGRSLVSYVGHASPLAWTFSGLLSRSDLDAGVLSNARPFIGAQWGCWGAFFVDPRGATLAHGLLVEGTHGAAALFGATGLTESAADQALAQELLPRLSAPGVRIGDAFRDAQSALATAHPEARDVWFGSVLLGDPALRLR